MVKIQLSLKELLLRKVLSLQQTVLFLQEEWFQVCKFGEVIQLNLSVMWNNKKHGWLHKLQEISSEMELNTDNNFLLITTLIFTNLMKLQYILFNRIGLSIWECFRYKFFIEILKFNQIRSININYQLIYRNIWFLWNRFLK